ncbi:CD209 antigen-like protein D [Daphnia pulicaria]|uniref:CD209 antigen-like protein D n=1 Tax=Daphnia pulicaria TaxID=35523 RepID=UPI001EEB3AB8|nr:CD209 antigen-like protein D [Daphnia pulicaria]
MVRVVVSYFYVLAIFLVSSGNGNVVPARDNNVFPGCGGYIFVDDEVVIDGPFNEDCIFQFETKEDRILAFSVVDGDLIETEIFLAIHDGIDSKAPVLLVENRKLLELSNQDLPTTVYTSQSEAVIQFTKKPTSNLKLKIQKAVRCAFNLGLDSQCGRVVDEVSCYCATFINRIHPDQTMFCVDHNMKLVSFENRTEEERVQAAWGTEVAYWTSLTDTRRDGSWLWESSMTVPVYTNWYPKRPNTAVNNVDDCMAYGGATFLTFWGDVACTTMAHAVCEAQP